MNARLETGLRVHLEKAGVVLGAEGLVGEGVEGNVVAVVVNEGGQILVQRDREVAIEEGNDRGEV